MDSGITPPFSTEVKKKVESNVGPQAGLTSNSVVDGSKGTLTPHVTKQVTSDSTKSLNTPGDDSTSKPTNEKRNQDTKNSLAMTPSPMSGSVDPIAETPTTVNTTTAAEKPTQELPPTELTATNPGI